MVPLAAVLQMLHMALLTRAVMPLKDAVEKAPKHHHWRKEMAQRRKMDTGPEKQQPSLFGNLPRPNIGRGPVFINFRPYMKNFYDVDIATNRFTADLVLTFQWADEAAVEALIPPGVKQLTIPLARARELLWLPDVVVSNRAGTQQLISSSVMVTSEGKVTKVDRVVATVLVAFVRDTYPFDSQELYVNVASSAYMAHDLKMVPMEVPNISNLSTGGNSSSVALDLGNISEGGLSGLTNASLTAFLEDPRALFAKLEIFKDAEYALSDTYVTTYDDSDSSLHKSRGRLTVKVKRRLLGFMLTSYLPVVLLQIVALGCFYFPVTGTFAMPRAVTVLVSQIAAILFAVSLREEMPPGNVLTWVDTFNAVVQAQLLAFMCLNLGCLHAAHNLKATDAAFRMNEDCKLVVVPLCLIINILMFLPPVTHMPVPWHAGIMALVLVLSYGAVIARVFAQMPRTYKTHDHQSSP